MARWSVAVAVTPGGAVVFADRGNNRIRRIRGDGTIVTVAGGGPADVLGDGGWATLAGLHQPAGVATTDEGGLLIADSGHHRVRRVSYGIISTVAGNGEPGVSVLPHTGQSTNVVGPAGLTAQADGGFLLADPQGQIVQRVGLGGIAAPLAGTGIAGTAGDGGPAVDAQLDFPEGIARLADGSVVIAEAGADRFRRVDPGGIISTVAGGRPRTARSLPAPYMAAPRSNRFYLRARSNRVRRTCPITIRYHVVADANADAAIGTQHWPLQLVAMDHAFRARVSRSVRLGARRLTVRTRGVGSDSLTVQVLRKAKSCRV